MCLKISVVKYSISMRLMKVVAHLLANNLNLFNISAFQKKLETAMSEDEFEVEITGLCGEILSPAPGGPFSALTPSMWPQDILAKLNQPDDPNSQPEYRYIL